MDGFLWGFGAAGGSYTYPLEFAGSTKKKVDKTVTLLGPTMTLGYNFRVKRLLLGLRAEGWYGNNLGTGNHKGSTTSNELNGRVSSFSGLAHLGWIIDLTMNDPVGQRLELLSEIFIEGGLTSGQFNLTKKYENNEGSTESIDEKLEESYQGRILSIGYNVTMNSGSFFEFKVSQMAMQSNKQTFTGEQNIGGSVSSRDRKATNEDLSNMILFSINIGKRF